MSFNIDGARKYFILEKDRLESFKSWPFKDSEKCSVKNMAEAGFYWCGNERENDTAACFACDKVLDGWESTDDPWAEHRKHAPQCVFVKLWKPERDITVDDFLNLLGDVEQSNLQKQFNALKKKFQNNYEKRVEKIAKTLQQ